MIFLISKRISRPLKKLTEGVTLIGAGGEVKKRSRRIRR